MGGGGFRKFARGSIPVFGALVLGLLLWESSRPAPRTRLQPRHFHGLGVLPLSGDLSPQGLAFQAGFLEGLRSAPDSLFDWTWDWKDGAGDPEQTWAATSQAPGTRTDLLLVGLSTATAGAGACPIECLVLGDGGPHAPDPRRWDLWTPATLMRDRWLRRLRGGPFPALFVVQASAAWTEPVFPVFSDSLPALSVVLHDPGNTRWDDVVQRVLELRPATLVLWDAPSEASSLLSRRLLWPALRKCRLWVPEGTRLPPGIEADTLRPIWQAGPEDTDSGWTRWGRRCGRALAQASRARILDSLPDWPRSLHKVPSDDQLESGDAGWYPTGP